MNPTILGETYCKGVFFAKVFTAEFTSELKTS